VSHLPLSGSSCLQLYKEKDSELGLGSMGKGAGIDY
jgi:hypothetical protein